MNENSSVSHWSSHSSCCKCQVKLEDLVADWISSEHVLTLTYCDKEIHRCHFPQHACHSLATQDVIYTKAPALRDPVTSHSSRHARSNTWHDIEWHVTACDYRQLVRRDVVVGGYLKIFSDECVDFRRLIDVAFSVCRPTNFDKRPWPTLTLVQSIVVSLYTYIDLSVEILSSN